MEPDSAGYINVRRQYFVMPSTKDQLDYAMKHFSFIADQRMKAFNFYIILFAASIAATMSAMDRLPKKTGFVTCGIIHILVAGVFFIMDQRSRRLVKLSLKAVRRIEAAND